MYIKREQRTQSHDCIEECPSKQARITSIIITYAHVLIRNTRATTSYTHTHTGVVDFVTTVG